MTIQRAVAALEEAILALEKLRLALLDLDTDRPIVVEQQALPSLRLRANGPPAEVFQRKIVKLVAEYFGLPESAVLGPGRRRELIGPRHVAMFVLHDHFNVSYPAIGRLFSRDHTSVMHGVANVRRMDLDIAPVLVALRAAQSEQPNGSDPGDPAKLAYYGDEHRHDQPE